MALHVDEMVKPLETAHVAPPFEAGVDTTYVRVITPPFIPQLWEHEPLMYAPTQLTAVKRKEKHGVIKPNNGSPQIER